MPKCGRLWLTSSKNHDSRSKGRPAEPRDRIVSHTLSQSWYLYHQVPPSVNSAPKMLFDSVLYKMKSFFFSQIWDRVWA